ncbi:EF-P lysine aminoacylase EpmA [Aliikangiella sp. IMCC44632]
MKNSILKQRASLLREIRSFFYQREVLEVDTPLLAATTVTDPYMSALQALNPQGKQVGYLQTSPEYAMKKLLCAGSGDIYQLSKMFRADEVSPRHNNEFTLLEWYRLGFDESQLIQEVVDLIRQTSGHKPVQLMSYRDAFVKYLNIDPFNITYDDLCRFSRECLGELPSDLLFDNYLTLLFATQVETQFDHHEITVVFDFPASQAALAKTATTHYGLVGKRFEVYCGGLELANGFYELTDPQEQLARFVDDNKIRAQLGYPEQKIDMALIEAMQSGLPACAGVALGVDRLLMLKLDISDIQAVLPMAFCDK